MDANQRTAVNGAARLVGDVMYDEALKSIGGPLIAKRKWGTFVKKANATRNPEAIVAYRGPVHWWESGTSAHLIVSRKVGGSRKSRGAMSPGPGMFKGKRGAVSTPAGPRAYARHLGQRPEPFFARAADRAGPVAHKEIRTQLVENPLRQIF